MSCLPQAAPPLLPHGRAGRGSAAAPTTRRRRGTRCCGRCPAATSPPRAVARRCTPLSAGGRPPPGHGWSPGRTSPREPAAPAPGTAPLALVAAPPLAAQPWSRCCHPSIQCYCSHFTLFVLSCARPAGGTYTSALAPQRLHTSGATGRLPAASCPPPLVGDELQTRIGDRQRPWASFSVHAAPAARRAQESRLGAQLTPPQCDTLST